MQPFQTFTSKDDTAHERLSKTLKLCKLRISLAVNFDLTIICCFVSAAVKLTVQTARCSAPGPRALFAVVAKAE